MDKVCRVLEGKETTKLDVVSRKCKLQKSYFVYSDAIYKSKNI